MFDSETMRNKLNISENAQSIQNTPFSQNH